MSVLLVRRRRVSSSTLSLLLVGATLVLAPPSLHPPATAERSARTDYELPLRFEVNLGQTDAGVRYLARPSSGSTVFFADDRVVWTLSDGANTAAAITMRPVDGERSRITHGAQLPGVSNYLRGRDERTWVRGAKAYDAVRYADVWDGVDVVFRASASNELEYDVVLDPGASPSVVRFSFAGPARPRIAEGALLIDTPAGAFTQRAPRAYQVLGDREHEVQSAFVLQGHELSFDVGDYDPTRPLVIDPVVLSYSTFLGGDLPEAAESVVVDGTGNAYVVGFALNNGYPACTDPGIPTGCSSASFDTSASDQEAVVTKLSAAGDGLVYSTFLGGDQIDYAIDIAVDAGQRRRVEPFVVFIHVTSLGDDVTTDAMRADVKLRA